MTLEESEKRRMELAQENMAIMADLSSARTEIARLEELIKQHYRDNEGHNHCWRNNYRLWEGIGLTPKQLVIPPLDEAMAGCQAFWEQLRAHPERWPDFIPAPADAPTQCGEKNEHWLLEK